MPYINQDKRYEFFVAIDNLASRLRLTDHPHPGELNYVITRLILESFPHNTYTELNTIIGVLECVKQEFYRRAVAPYEDLKKSDNGDVY